MALEARSPIVCIAANTTWYVHNFRGRLIAQLIKNGYEVTVLSPPDEYVSRILALGARHVSLPMNRAGTNPLIEGFTLLRLAHRLSAIRPDVLLTFTPKVNIYAAIAARVIGIPVIANVSGLGRVFIAGGWLEAVVRRLYWIAFREARRVFFQNEDDRAEFLRARIVQCDRTERLPGSGVDTDRFSPASKRPERLHFVFLLVARLLWDKGIAEYVEAARRIQVEHPDARFRILGFLEIDNPSAIPRNELELWTNAGWVEYLGAVDDPRPSYSEADCVVLPSYYREGVPRTLLEAASMGLPIITTDAPGCRDTVDDGVTGHLCRPRDTGHLVEMMRRMLSMNEEERHRMGAAGREKMTREFDEEIVITRYLEVVDDILRSATLRM